MEDVRARQLFGRGFRQVVWQLPAFRLFAVLFAVSLQPLWTLLFHAGNFTIRRPNLFLVALREAPYELALVWILGRVRRPVPLFAALLGLGYLQGCLSRLISLGTQMLAGRTVPNLPVLVLGLDVRMFIHELLGGSMAALAILGVLALRRRRLWLAPVVTLGCAWISIVISVGLLWLSIGIGLHMLMRFDPQLLAMPVPSALLLGLATWAGLECQYRKEDSVPVPEAGPDV